MPSTGIDRIDGNTTSVAVKSPCTVVSNAPIKLFGIQTIDGVLLQAGSGGFVLADRVLVNGQADPTCNGIYLVQKDKWKRAYDFDGPRDAVEGTLVSVRSGATYANTLWELTTTDNPVIFGMSAITFSIYNHNSAVTVTPQMQVGVQGADSVMFVGFDEFIYNPIALFGADGSPFNCSYDVLFKGLPPNQAKGNINYTLAQDLAPCASVRTCVMWQQWWTVASGPNMDMTQLQPGINHNVITNLGTTTWSVNGVQPADALLLQGKIGGTADDTAYLLGAQLIAARGYKIGIAPVAIGVDTDPLNPSTSWRGYFAWDSTADFSSWLTKYDAFVKHAFDVLNNAGIPVDIVYVGSEMQAITTSATDAIWDLWIAELENLAAYIKAQSPSTKVTYAANWSEYGNGGNFRLDSLWTCSNIDYVGVDWYPPIAITPNDDYNEFTANLRAGEDMDFFVDSSDNTQRSILTCSRMGKVGLLQNSMLPPQGIKNLHGFYYNNHYLLSGGDTQAEATPLPGYDRTYNPNGLGIMTNVPGFGLSSNLPAASGDFGSYPGAGLYDTWAQFSATASDTSFTLPIYSGNQDFQYINLTFAIGASPANGGRLFRTIDQAGNVLEAFANTSTQKVMLNVNGALIALCALDTLKHSVQIKIDVVDGVTYTSADGGAQTQTLTSDPLILPSGGVMFIASSDGIDNALAFNLYNLQIYLTIASVVVFVKAITQMQAGGWGGRRYGSFIGRETPVTITRYTQLQLGGWGGRRYGAS